MLRYLLRSEFREGSFQFVERVRRTGFVLQIHVCNLSLLVDDKHRSLVVACLCVVALIHLRNVVIMISSHFELKLKMLRPLTMLVNVIAANSIHIATAV